MEFEFIMISSKFNAIYFGLIMGILLPLLTLIIFYLLRSKEETFLVFLRISYNYKILSNLISLAAIPNALLFFVFLRMNKLQNAKGVILSLFLLCLLVIILKISS